MGMTIKKNAARRRPRRATQKKRIDINADTLDYLNADLLKRFVTENGRIIPRRITGMPAKLHRKLDKAIKRARQVQLVK